METRSASERVGPLFERDRPLKQLEELLDAAERGRAGDATARRRHAAAERDRRGAFRHRRTVETHLTQAYGKLEIGSREGLPEALEGRS